MTRRPSTAGPRAADPFIGPGAANRVHLRILETTDLHGYLHPYDYFADRPLEHVGLATLATRIRAMRNGAANTLLFDNGDFLQGNPMTDFVAFERGVDHRRPHPMIAAFNALGLDAATIGNHEFNYGLDFLVAATRDAAFPVVLANVARDRGPTPLGDRTLYPPFAILERSVVDGAGNAHDLRVGVIGFTPPQIMIWDRRHLEGRVVARDILEAARAYVPTIRAAGADLVVALCHSGIGEAEPSPGTEHAAVPLAALPGIDVVLTGHTHGVFPGPGFEGRDFVDPGAGTIHGKPATMAGFWGSHLGVIDLVLEKSGRAWRIARHRAEAQPVARGTGAGAGAASDPEILEVVADDHRATLEYIRRPVAKTARALHSYFAFVGPDPSVGLVAAAQKRAVERLLAGGPHAALPVLSAAAPFKVGGPAGPHHFTDVPAGEVAIRNIADLYLYPNTLAAVRVTGAVLRDWLERAAGAFNTLAPGVSDQPLLDPAFASYNFDAIAGVAYRIDLSRPPRYDARGEVLDPTAKRIVELSHLGAPVRDDMTFVVATNNYRAAGGGRFPGLSTASTILAVPETQRDIVTRYLIETGADGVAGVMDWGFRAMPGTSAWFDTGPGAMGYLAEESGGNLRHVGAAPGGFVRFRLAL